MDLKFGFPQLDYYSVEKGKHCVLTTTLPRFSSREHFDSKFTDYDTSDRDFKVFFRPEFYANGDRTENIGYVSILFHVDEVMFFYNYFSYIEINCMAAVIDASGKEKFMQSFGHVYDKSDSPLCLEHSRTFGLDQFVKRETLCSDPSELIPGDCLTIRIEVDYVLRYQSEEAAKYAFRKHIVGDGNKIYLSLDSPVWQELRKVCDYFRRASDTDMVEQETRRWFIPDEERRAFYHMNTILSGAEDINISVADICQVYTVAEKYGIETIMETCRQMVNSILGRINDSHMVEHAVKCIPMILELAETHRDESLKESVAVYLENKEKFETSVYAFEERVKEKLNTDWSCEFQKIDFSSGYFKMSRLNSKEPKMENYVS